MTEKVAGTLQLGAKFWVEPNEHERIPVQITEFGDRVGDWLHVPCRRLDTHDGIVVHLPVWGMVELYEEE